MLRMIYFFSFQNFINNEVIADLVPSISECKDKTKCSNNDQKIC